MHTSLRNILVLPAGIVAVRIIQVSLVLVCPLVMPQPDEDDISPMQGQ